LFGVAERPDLIALNALGRYFAHYFVVEGRASKPGINQKLRNGIERDASYPRDRAHAGTFTQHGEDLDAGMQRQAVHVGYID
jgi:hypothetical protein